MTNQNIKDILLIPEVKNLFKIFGDNKIYLVGGCVRNALNNEKVNDIDFFPSLHHLSRTI